MATPRELEIDCLVRARLSLWAELGTWLDKFTLSYNLVEIGNHILVSCDCCRQELVAQVQVDWISVHA